MDAKKKVTILPYTDIFVRYLLGDEKNTDLLLSFINAVNKDNNLPLIKTVTIRNPYNLKEVAKDKETILDVKATDEFGDIYNIEIQASGNETFKYRSLYYWAKLYSSQIEAGEKYYELKPTVSINLLNFNLIESENVHSCFSLYEKNNHELMLTNHLLIHFIEIKKFIQESNFQNDFEKWLAYFKYEGIREDIMQVIVDNNSVFAKAHDRFKNFTKDDKLVELYESRKKWQMDKDTEIGYAEMKGRQEGKSENAKKMLVKGYSVEDISDITGLSEQEINKL
jgi:predicted transposase/invertase (TIGR01784 family)